MSDKASQTDMLRNIAGGNKHLNVFFTFLQKFWNANVNRYTKKLVIIVGIVGTLFYFGAVRPPQKFPTNALITIEKGQDVDTISHMLEKKGVIRSGTVMRMMARLYGIDRSLHAGDYLFKESANLFEVMRRISQGVFGLQPVVIRVRDGSTVKDIAKLLEKKMLRFDKEKFLRIASTQEGFLFPDTYYFLPNAPEEKIIGAMVDNFYAHYKQLEPYTKKTHMSLHDIVTLASIVELEAWKYEDRRKIAGVLLNRLAIGMPLQVDVSFVYIMNKGSFQVTRKDMRHQSPYNTYVHTGLPPGPIWSPSLESLRAVLHPAGREHRWLFYLADRKGNTYYSTTYKQHLAKKRRYIDGR